MSVQTVSTNRSHGGTQGVYRHASRETKTDMTFSVYVPDHREGTTLPVVTYLSGLTCTHANVTEKGEFRSACAEHGLIFVAPDTSPRGEGVPGDPANSYDFGLGAGFYVDATAEPWSAHYRMYTYVTQELRGLIEAKFPVDPARTGIFGHSMGGHGALTLGLRNPDLYRSISAFAPISAPKQCPWGKKALTGYLGPDRGQWAEHDATELVSRVTNASGRSPILIDQGLADQFLEQQLHPHLFEEAARKVGYPVTVRRHAGYDHGYYFISTFVEDHLRHHARILSAR